MPRYMQVADESVSGRVREGPTDELDGTMSADIRPHLLGFPTEGYGWPSSPGSSVGEKQRGRPLCRGALALVVLVVGTITSPSAWRRAGNVWTGCDPCVGTWTRGVNLALMLRLARDGADLG